MSNQRKRVAKRLASGLLAGALALGGLAISGGTASAVTPASPSTNRLGGSDRYATSVALANAYAAAPTHVVVASGESWADGLAASAYASLKSAPILLVGQNTLPGAVRDYFLVKNTSITGVTIIGGTAAVSDSVKTAIASVLDVSDTITRVAGATRYGTMAAVATTASVFDANDSLFIASGESFADALSVSGWASNQEWPIILTPGSALGAEATAVVTAAVTAGVTRVYLIGGTSVLSEKIVEDLVLLGVTYDKITRLAGADRYATNTAVNTALYASADTAYKGERVALINGASYADALASAPFLGKEDANGNAVHSVMVNAGVPAGAQALVGTLAGTRGGAATAVASSALQQLWVVGGTSAVSEEVKTAVSNLAQSTTDKTGIIASCPEGATGFSVFFGDGADDVDLGILVKGDFTANGVSLSNANDSVTPADADGDTINDSILVTVNGGLVAGTTYGFVGKTEVQTTNGRDLNAVSCTVLDDTTGPTITGIEVEPNASGLFYVTTSEKVAGLNAFADFAGTTLAATGEDIATVTPISDTLYKVQIGDDADADTTVDAGEEVAIAAADTITVAVSNVTDVAGNALQAAFTVTVGVADATAPGVTATYSCTATTVGATTVADGVGVLDFTGPKGAATNAWKVTVVNQRGINVPKVAVDSSAKTVTVTIDRFYQDLGDIINAFVEQAAGSGWAASLTAGAGAADTPAAAMFAATGLVVSGGNDACTITAVANEKVTALTIGSPALNGVALGAMTVVGAAATPVSSTYSFNTNPTVVLDAGTVSATITATDIGGASVTVTIPVTKG